MKGQKAEEDDLNTYKSFAHDYASPFETAHGVQSIEKSRIEVSFFPSQAILRTQDKIWLKERRQKSV